MSDADKQVANVPDDEEEYDDLEMDVGGGDPLRRSEDHTAPAEDYDNKKLPPVKSINNTSSSGDETDYTTEDEDLEIDVETGKQGADKEDEEDDDDEMVKSQKPIVGGGNKKDEEETKKSNRRKLAGGICIVLTLLILFLVAIALLFGVERSPLSGVRQARQTGVPTAAPTSSPVELPPATSTPTLPPQTPTPTVSPTPKPTPPPVPTGEIPPIGISALPCDEIRVGEEVTAGNFGNNNFKVTDVLGTPICGDTYGGFDPERPERNFWSVRVGRRDCVTSDFFGGWDVCRSVGARRCSLTEFEQNVAQGTGCGGDQMLLYSGEECVPPQGGIGVYTFNVGFNTTRQPFVKCEADLTLPSIIRCCGDNY